MKSKNLGIDHKFTISVDQEAGEIAFVTDGKVFAKIEIETLTEDVADPDAPGMIIEKPTSDFALHFIVPDWKVALNSKYAGVEVRAK